MWAVADCVVMSASLEALEDSLFEDTGFDEKVTRFASDSGCQVVYITKETFVDIDEDGKPKWTDL
jgi:dynein heavy chain 1